MDRINFFKGKDYQNDEVDKIKVGSRRDIEDYEI